MWSVCCNNGSEAAERPAAAGGPERAFATLTTNDAYVVGVVALYRSLHRAGCLADGTPLVVMVNAEVSAENRELLTELGAVVVEVKGAHLPSVYTLPAPQALLQDEVYVCGAGGEPGQPGG